MTDAFDPRIIRLGIQIEGDVIFFENEDIRIQGTKTADQTMNQATIKISNLPRDMRNYILTKATPYTSPKHPEITPLIVTIDAGRESYGTFRLFEGQVIASSVTPPPDIGIVLNSITNGISFGALVGVSMAGVSSLKSVAERVAKENNLVLKYQVKDGEKQIANFSFSGSAGKLIDKLKNVGDIRAYVDNNTLIVTDKDKPNGDDVFTLNMASGMVGVPQATQSGATARMLLNPNIKLGGRIKLESKINPAVNGEDYFVSGLSFDIANRDNPFFYSLTLSNLTLLLGTT